MDRKKRAGIICYRDKNGQFTGPVVPIGNCAPPTEEEYSEVDKALAQLFAQELLAEVESGKFAEA